MGVRDDATLGEHSRPAAMDDSHRVTGNTDRLVHSEGGGEVLIGGNVRELRLWEQEEELQLCEEYIGSRLL